MLTRDDDAPSMSNATISFDWVPVSSLDIAVNPRRRTWMKFFTSSPTLTTGVMADISSISDYDSHLGISSAELRNDEYFSYRRITLREARALAQAALEGAEQKRDDASEAEDAFFKYLGRDDGR